MAGQVGAMRVEMIVLPGVGECFEYVVARPGFPIEAKGATAFGSEDVGPGLRGDLRNVLIARHAGAVQRDDQTGCWLVGFCLCVSLCWMHSIRLYAAVDVAVEGTDVNVTWADSLERDVGLGKE